MARGPHGRPRRDHQDYPPTVQPAQDDPNRPTTLITGPIQDQPDKEPAKELPSLSNLSCGLHARQSQQQASLELQARLYQSHVLAARTTRLLHTARSVQRTLAECIKAEDKHSFVNLFNALRDASSSGGREHVGTSSGSAQAEGDHAGYPSSFLDALSSRTRHTLLDFVLKVKQDEAFVADRLAALTQKELVALLPDKRHPRSTDSVFGSSSRISSRASRHLSFVVDGQTDLLSSFEFSSPLETLVSAVRGLSGQPLYLDPEAIDLWATVCAKLISEHKPGSERLVPAVIDLWATSSDWPGKDQLRLWICDVLQQGMPLLEQDSRKTFRVRAGVRLEQDLLEEKRLEVFYTESVHSLLALLADPEEAGVIPIGARSFCHAICQKLEGVHTHRQAFPNFVLNRWLFASYIPDALTCPEIHGLFTDHYITDNARQRLLREVAGRCHKASFDVSYSWKHGNNVSTELKSAIEAVAARFDDVHCGLSTMRSMGVQYRRQFTDTREFLAVSATDIGVLVNALYPTRDSFVEHGDSRLGMHSSASSVSGFSLFPSQSAFVPPQTNTLNCDVPTPDPLAASLYDSSSGGPAKSAEKADLSYWEAERLREARSAVEDCISGHSSHSEQDWAILVLQLGNHRLHTVKESLLTLTSAKEAVDTYASHQTVSSRVEACVAPLETLLLNVDPIHLHRSARYPQEALPHEGVAQEIEAMFQKYIATLQERSMFVSAHTWHRRLERFQALTDKERHHPRLRILLETIEASSQCALESASRIEEWCANPLANARLLNAQQTQIMRRFVDTATQMRDKMWYVAEVRTSAIYDNTRIVASALKIMGKSKKPDRTRTASAARQWTGSKPSSAAFNFKNESQVLELLSAPLGYGGPNKLSDDQSRALAVFLERNAVENMCNGEERIQRLCMEVRKAVANLTSEDATTWSSVLFARDQLSSSVQSRWAGIPLWPMGAKAYGVSSLQSNVPGSLGSIYSASSHPLSAQSSRDRMLSSSPTLTNRSSTTFWSPALSEAPSPSSATSVGSAQTYAPHLFTRRQTVDGAEGNAEAVKEHIRQRVASLLLSDLATSLYPAGSETDKAFWTGLGGEMTEKYERCLRLTEPEDPSVPISPPTFGYAQAFEKLLRLFSATCNPYEKLRHLHDIDALLTPYMAELSTSPPDPKVPEMLRTVPDPWGGLEANRSAVFDAKVQGFRRLFSNSKLRPKAIFRDMQNIAAIVPRDTLASMREGEAFWHAAGAVMAIKHEVCMVMVETADSIIAYHSIRGGTAQTSSTAQQERDSATFSASARTPLGEDVSRYKLRDAAELLQIAAKEGDCVAQRELATLYLTDPDLMDHIIAPLSRPRDVFKEELESKWRKNQDPNRCDPATMCVAHHWMSLSSKGGDALATKYLRQREEMDRLG